MQIHIFRFRIEVAGVAGIANVCVPPMKTDLAFVDADLVFEVLLVKPIELGSYREVICDVAGLLIEAKDLVQLELDCWLGLS